MDSVSWRGRAARPARAQVAAVMVVAMLAAAAVVTGPGRAAYATITRADTWASGLVAGVDVASNLNTTLVAAVNAADGRVVVRNVDTGVTNPIGRPADSSAVRRLAVSAAEVYALLANGAVYHFDSATRVWQHLRDGMVDLLASRDGTVSLDPNTLGQLHPFLYGVDRDGGVWRQDGQSWTLIGSGAGVGSLAERGWFGRTSLYELNSARTLVQEWGGAPGSWVPIGGMARSITANQNFVLVTSNSGQPMTYLDAPFKWTSWAVPAGTAVPVAPGGRAILGERSMYYRTATGELFGIRGPSALPGIVVVTPWWHLASSTVDSVAPHQPVRGDADATVLRHEGVAVETTWGSIDLAAVSFAPPDAVQGEDYHAALAVVTDWTGWFGATVLSGTLPPGITAGSDHAGHLLLSGRATAAGSFTATLRLWDDVGAVRDLPITVVVQPPGGVVITSDDVVNPTSGIELGNCLRSRAPMHVLVRNATRDESWSEIAGSPVPAQLDAAGVCRAGAGSGARWPTVPADLIEVVALDTAAPQCAGRVDPSVLGCVAMRRWITGSPGSPTDFRVVTG